MSEMIERAARAIHLTFGFKEWPKGYECENCLIAAKAAIEAMREPTEAMLDAGAYDLDMTLEQQYKRMIEAALK